MSADIIQDICRHLSAEGKTPTTALVKAKAPAGTSLALIIQGVARFKASDSQPQEKDEHVLQDVTEASVAATPAEVNKTLNEHANQLFLQKRRIEHLEIANQTLLQEIKDLQKQVQVLSGE
jgi:chromosome segregation ATPase